MNVFDLVAKITLDQSEYDKGLGESEKKFEGFGAKLKKGLGTAAKVGGAAIAAVGAAGVALTKSVMDGAAEAAAYGDNIDKMSQKLGISAQAYQEWDAILQHSGSSIDGMQRGMMTLSNAVVKGSDAFGKLGLSQEEVASMSQEDLFGAVIKGLQGMEEGAERTALAQELLGGAAKELGPLLNTSAEDTEAMRQRVHELGGVMSDEGVKAAAAYQDSLQDMQTAFSGIKRGLVSGFLPSITKVMDGLTEIFTGDSDKGIGMISNGIDEVVKNISDKMPKLIKLGGKIVKAIGKAILDNLPKIMGSAGQIVGQIIAGIVSALPELIRQAPAIISAVIQGLAEAWPEIQAAGGELLAMLWDGIQAAWGWFTGIVSEQFGLIKDNLLQNWQTMKDDAARTWDDIKSTVSEKVNNLKTTVSTTFENIRKTIKNAIDKVKKLFNFEWKFPDLKLPHIVVGEYIDVPVLGRIPNPKTLSVEWYKKAYSNPYVFTKPTIAGFGDGNGGEMVYGHENLMKDIRAAVGDGKVTINVYPSQGMDEEKLARKIEKIFVDRSKQRRLLNA